MLLALVLAAVCAAASVWQWQRGADKARAEARRALAATLPAVRLSDGMSTGRVRVAGQFIPGRTLLLDNRTHGGRAGVHVFDPLLLDDGARIVLVHRGFLAWPGRREVPHVASPPAGFVELEGEMRPMPAAGLRLDDAGGATGWPRLLQHLDADTAGAALGVRIAQAMFVPADPAVAVGPLPDAAPGMTPARHRAYAVQWALLSITLLILAGVALRVARRAGRIAA